MSRIIRTACVLTVAAFLVAVVLPFAPAAGNVRTAAEKRVIMCGRSVLENWFYHWGWDGDNAHTVSQHGYTLQHAENLQDLDQMAGIFSSTCDAVPAGSSPVMFFKFCFADFFGDNLAQLQGIANQIIQTAREHGLRLIIGNALPVVAADTNPQLVSEHRAYNAWLNSKAGSNLWIYDMYGVLSDGSGALKAAYANDGDSHPNNAGYNALDTTFFPFLAGVFGSQPPPTPNPVTVKRSWYFAEGTTANGFEEYICIQNPTVNDATVQATYMLTGGAATQVGAPFPLARTSRTTINVGDAIKNSDVSVRIDSNQDVICERSVYWNNRVEGTNSIGVTSPGTTWYLPEGCTAYGFEEYLCIQNPQSKSATVNITYNTAQGPKERDPLTISANSRKTVKVNDEVIPPGNVSITLTSNRGVVAERAMYWDSRRGGHASIGTNSLSTKWFLAEGSNNWGYETFVLVQNPGTTDANVSVKFLTTEGPIDMKPFTVSAGSRYTIETRKVVNSKDFSTSITSDQPITCERSMYWNNGTGKAGHDTIGVTAAALNNYLAEGCTNHGFDTYVLIANPNDKPNEVIVTYMTSNGEVPMAPFTIDPNRRFTCHVNKDLNWQPLDVSIRVVGNYPVVAERAMYWNAKGGGHDSIGFMSNK